MLLVLVLLLQVAVPNGKPSDANVDARLLESGQGTTLRKPVPNAREIKVVSYNIRWRTGAELRQIAKLLRDDPKIGGASIVGLQEVDRRKKRTGNSNSAKTLADELGMHYVWTAPPSVNADGEEETGVTILSLYPLTDVQRIVLPHPGPNRRRRVALGATVEVDGQPWRIYSAHAETRIPLDKKMEQYSAILEDLKRYPAAMPTIVMGDFNTWEPNAGDKTVKLFAKAGFSTPFDGKRTFHRSVFFIPIELRLDWMWLRGLEANGCGINREIEISDHFPIWTTVKRAKPDLKSTCQSCQKR